MHRRLASIGLPIAFLACPAAWSGSPPPQAAVAGDLVWIPVTVSDPYGRAVTGLAASQFTLTVDNAARPIAAFSSKDEPHSVVFVIDASADMAAMMPSVAGALLHFAASANPGDEFLGVSYASKAAIAVPFTRSADSLKGGLNSLRPGGRAALLDGVMLALNEMRHAQCERKAVVIVSNSGINQSIVSEDEVLEATQAAGAGVQVYAVEIAPPAFPPNGRDESDGGELLDNITRPTGGETFPIRDVSELPDILSRIGNGLRSEYLIGFAPAKAGDGKWHKLAVKLDPPPGLPPLTVAAPVGYHP